MPLSPLFPQLWSARITYFAEQNSAFLPNATRAWEGEAVYGNQITIPTVDRDVTMHDYSRTTDLNAPEAVHALTQTLLIDQEKYFNFAVEDLDARQSRIPGSQLIDLKSQGAGIASANEIDDHVARLLQESSDATTTEFLYRQDRGGSATAKTARNFTLKFLNQAHMILTQAKLPANQYVMITTPEFIRALNDDTIDGKYEGSLISRNTDSAAQPTGTGSQTQPNGLAMRLGGWPVYVSSSLRLRLNQTGSNAAAQVDVAGTERGNISKVWLYNPADLALVAQVNQVVAYRPEKRFSSAVKGLMNWGAKIIIPPKFKADGTAVTDAPTRQPRMLEFLINDAAAS